MAEKIKLETINNFIEIEPKILFEDLIISNSKVSGIYLIYNKLNKRIYIGQAKNILGRWKGHCETWTAKRKCKKRQYIDRAIEKYGKENFEVYVLDICMNDEFILNELEYYWADKYSDCYVPVGYNIQMCGLNKRNLNVCTEVSCYDNEGNLIKTFASIGDAIIEHTYTVAFVLNDNSNYCKADGYYWRRGHKPKIDTTNLKPLKTGPNGGKTLYKYNLKTGEYEDSFKSANDAALKLSLGSSAAHNIQKCAKRKIRSAYDSYWSYIKDSNIFNIRPDLKISSQTYKWITMYQYDLEGNFIKEYPNLQEATKSVNVGPGEISWASKGNGTCRKYYWRRYKVKNLFEENSV